MRLTKYHVLLALTVIVPCWFVVVDRVFCPAPKVVGEYARPMIRGQDITEVREEARSVTKTMSLSANLNFAIKPSDTEHRDPKPLSTADALNQMSELFSQAREAGDGLLSETITSTSAVEPLLVEPESGFGKDTAQSATDVVPLPALGDFITRIKVHISSVDDVVHFRRFYTDHNLSFAKTGVHTYPSGKQTPALMAISDKSPPVRSELAKGVHPLAWVRSWYKENYLVQKSGFPSTFSSLSRQIQKIRQIHTAPLPAIRYQTYTTPCKFVKTLGDPSVLPVPVMLTFRLDFEVGHLSGDTYGKTCINRAQTGECTPTVLQDVLNRCKESVDHFRDVLDNPKILLLVTNQQQSLYHDKILSLPLGVERDVAAEIIKVYGKLDFHVERNTLIAISNFAGNYSARVSFTNGYYGSFNFE
jgi:hypothetical protein